MSNMAIASDASVATPSRVFMPQEAAPLREEPGESLKPFIVEAFSRGSPEGPCLQHFEFVKVEEALKCARRIVDRSLKRTRVVSRSAVEWYRRWAACGDFVVAPGAGFDSRKYAKWRIRMVDQGFEWITEGTDVNESERHRHL